MNLNIDQLREQTPGVQNVVHFNNAGASLMPKCVLDEITSYLQLESNIGAYEAASQMKSELDDIYRTVAKLINCDVSEIALTENGTRAWSILFHSIPFKQGDRILISPTEYISNYISQKHLCEKLGVSLEIIPMEIDGTLSLSVLKKMIDDRVKAIFITHILKCTPLSRPKMV